MFNPYILDLKCENNTYNITTNIPIFTIPIETVACFTCNLPGGAVPDEWTINGHFVNDSFYLKDVLLVENPRIIFSNFLTTSSLTCKSMVTNDSRQALIAFKGTCNLLFVTADDDLYFRH